MAHREKILVIRRDNIGDLVCTTPMLQQLRAAKPQAKIDLLVNDYNAAVVACGQPMDQVFIYRKAKHKVEGESRWRIWLGTAALILRLRRARYDWVILAGATFSAQAWKFARLIAPQRVICYGNGTPLPAMAEVVDAAQSHGHHVERTARLLARMHIEGPIPATRILPEVAALAAVQQQLKLPPARRTVAIHISARKPSQRWPEAMVVAFIRWLCLERGARVLLFWSPGPEDHPAHPGDDDKAARILQQLAGLPVQGMATQVLSQLIAGLSLCDSMVCSDGGAMHLASALGKPLVCFFGQSDAEEWRPWNQPYRLLQPTSRDVSDISLAEAQQAFDSLPSP